MPAAPLVKEDSVEAGGRPVLGSSPSGVTLRFIERGRFGIGIVLRNRSHRSLTVVDARTVEPLDGLVHRVGTRLLPWNPPPCSGMHSCPVIAFLQPSYGVVQPVPVEVGPGRSVGVQLNFRLGRCDAVPFASPAPTRLLDVTYRYEGEEASRHESIPLRSARLRLGRPARCS
jgi:hypothetical protein